jgi:hypothetical protein
MSALNAKISCYITAHVIINFLIFLEVVDRLDPATTSILYTPMVRVRTTDKLQQKQELVQHIVIMIAASCLNLLRTW